MNLASIFYIKKNDYYLLNNNHVIKYYKNNMKIDSLLHDSPIHLLICEYLNILDIQNLLLLNKKLYYSKNNINYSNKIIKKKSCMHILKIFKKFMFYLKYINGIEPHLLTRRFNAYYYFKYYPTNAMMIPRLYKVKFKLSTAP